MKCPSFVKLERNASTSEHDFQTIPFFIHQIYWYIQYIYFCHETCIYTIIVIRMLYTITSAVSYFFCFLNSPLKRKIVCHTVAERNVTPLHEPHYA